MKLSSAAFATGGDIPDRCTCQGEDLSPALSWTEAPAGTRSFALILEDPDVPLTTATHWLIWGIPAGTTSLREALPNDEILPDGSMQGRNTFGRIGWMGPCPPNGKYHRYFFRLFALDFMPDLEPGSSRRRFDRAIEGHVLATAEFMGRHRKVPLGTFVKTMVGL